MRTARAWTGAFLGLLIGVGVAVAATADPVALLVKFDGAVEVERPGVSDPLPGEIGLQLMAGDRVVVGEGAQAVVLYRNGTLVRAAAPVTIEDVADDGGSSSLFASTVRTLGQVATTDARTQPNRQGMIRPIAGAPVPVAPRNDIKVLGPRPTFRWRPVPEVERYILQIQRLGPPAAEPVGYRIGADTAWTLPASEPPLIPGARYSWTVGGESEGRVAEPKHFVVASADDVAAVQAALDALIAAGIDPSADGLFLAALSYRDAGLMYEAQRALDLLEGQGAGTGQAFFMLKGEVLDAIGDMEGAREAFGRAGPSGD